MAALQLRDSQVRSTLAGKLSPGISTLCNAHAWQHSSLQQQGMRTISLEVLLLHLVNDLRECIKAIEALCAVQMPQLIRKQQGQSIHHICYAGMLHAKPAP